MAIMTLSFIFFLRSGFESARRRFASPGGSVGKDERDGASEQTSARTPMAEEKKAEPKTTKPEPKPTKTETKAEAKPKPEAKPGVKKETKTEKPQEKAKPEPRSTSTERQPKEKKEEKIPEMPKDEEKPEPPRFFRKKDFAYNRPQSPRMEHKTYNRPTTPDQRPETPEGRDTPEATPPPRRRRFGNTIPEEPEVEDLGPDTEDGKKSAYDYIKASRSKPGAAAGAEPQSRAQFARYYDICSLVTA